MEEGEELEDCEGAEGGAGGLTIEEEGEQAEADGVALFVESAWEKLARILIQVIYARLSKGVRDGNIPLLQVLNVRNALLSIAHHLAEEIGEACLAELACPSSVQRSAVYCLSICWVFQARRSSGIGRC